MSQEPIWIIDPDLEDQEIVQTVFQQLGLSNELVPLNDADEAFDRLASAQRAPFIIISELNLPGENAFDFRQRLLDTHSKKFKSVPFIIWSSHISETQITRAYDLAVHGIFIKDSTLDELKETFSTIIRYWLKSQMPSKEDKPK